MSNQSGNQYSPTTDSIDDPGSRSSLLCCGCLRRDSENTDIARRMEQDREEGQALLMSMVMSSSEDVDWPAVIAKANELHAKEQEWLRRRNKRERVLFERRQRKALQERKRFDSIGSFSVNMLTYRMSSVPCAHEQSHHHDEGDRKQQDPCGGTLSVGSTGDDLDDDQSSSPDGSPVAALTDLVSSNRDNEENNNMETISEKTEQPVDDSPVQDAT